MQHKKKVLTLSGTTANCVVTITTVIYLMLKIARSVARPCWLSMQGRGDYKYNVEPSALCPTMFSTVHTEKK